MLLRGIVHICTNYSLHFFTYLKRLFLFWICHLLRNWVNLVLFPGCHCISLFPFGNPRRLYCFDTFFFISHCFCGYNRCRNHSNCKYCAYKTLPYFPFSHSFPSFYASALMNMSIITYKSVLQIYFLCILVAFICIIIYVFYIFTILSFLLLQIIIIYDKKTTRYIAVNGSFLIIYSFIFASFAAWSAAINGSMISSKSPFIILSILYNVNLIRCSVTRPCGKL